MPLEGHAPSADSVFTNRSRRYVVLIAQNTQFRLRRRTGIAAEADGWQASG